MSIGLLALLDDVAAIAKVAAASIDDVVGQAGSAGASAAGVVIDDTAVTPRYVVGFSAQRELPIVAKIAIGSLRNKLLILLPLALGLSYLMPWAITPLLMIGGAYLCYEGVEKIYEAVRPHEARAHETEIGTIAFSPKTLEDEKVAGAIKTDFILSAEIMAIALASVPHATLWSQALVLAIVGIGITAGVYGVVALIVKADDVGVAMARTEGATAYGATNRGLGRALVFGMPGFLAFLSAAGTAAMIWVGGGIIVHGLEAYGLHAIPHGIEVAAQGVAGMLSLVAGAAYWAVTAALSGLVGIVIGAAAIPVIGLVVAPAWTTFKRSIRSR